MKVRYTKVGDLEAALAVDAEIKSLQFAVDNAERSKAAEPGDDSMVVLETGGSTRLRFVKGPFTRKEAEAPASSMGGKLATVRRRVSVLES